MNAPTGNVFIVTAPSGAGKTSLVNALIERVPTASLSISHTTRPPRPGEADGEHYHFIDEATFAAMVAEHAFFEHATVFGNRYGTSYQSIDDLLAADRDVILEIDWQGAQQIKRQINDAISIFILPPSLAVLKSRLVKRAQDAADVIARRLGEAREEIAHHAEFDYLVVNDDFDHALGDLVAILRTARLRAVQQRQRCGELIENLLDDDHLR